ncbi:hypothetical protein [Niabella sp.]|uniref:hypothetical protein n=1 Tax=Niabella sp. TaxID=1962976 RepID=UPI002627F8CF|nr:hypothetical protein [Niabella sp.]
MKHLPLLGIFIILKSMNPLHINAQNDISAFCDLKEIGFKYGDLTRDDNKYSYSIYDLNRGRTGFKENIKHKVSNQSLIPAVVHVSVQQLASWTSLINKTFDSRIKPEDHRGIKMSYGLTQANKLIIIFQPVLLVKRTNRNETHYDIKYVNVQYLQKSDGSFEETDDAQTYTNAYQKNTIFKRKNGSFSDFNDFEFDYDKGDTKSCIMPLLQIKDMYFANNHNLCNAKDSITFEAIANNYFRVNRRSIKNYKVHIVAYISGKISDNTIKTLTTDDYKELGADFGQMDPPNKDYVDLPDEIHVYLKEKKRQPINPLH